VAKRRGGRRNARRVSVGEAAFLLGISKDAVRARIRQGTLRSEKTDDQTVHVWLSDDLYSDRSAVHPRARLEGSLRGRAKDIEELREQVHHLREILAEERSVGGGGDRIIAQLTRANASLAPLVPDLEASAPPMRPEAAKPTELKSSQPQRAEPEWKGPGRETRRVTRSVHPPRGVSPAPSRGDGSAAEGAKVDADSREAAPQTLAASRMSRLERRLEAIKRRQLRPETLSAVKLLTTEEIRRALELTERAGVLPNGDVRRPEAFRQATPGELEALEHWRKLCGEPLDHLDLAEELLDRMGDAHSWRSPEANDAAQLLQRLERPDGTPWFVAKMAEAVLNFYDVLEQHPNEPQHPRVRGAVRRLERLNAIGSHNLAELQENPEAAAEGSAP
jgi:hypothetical protein